MKIMTIVGARPQFIKEAMVSHAMTGRHEEILVHTGQHFDYNMSEEFFEELDIPKPKYNLGISGGTHAEMTSKMLIELEKVMINEKPDMVVLYGDTNSTLSGSIAAAKLHIPITHVEALARCHDLTNPEEINRVCVDHLSSLLLTSTEHALENAKKEGLIERARFVGNTMYEAFVKYTTKSDNKKHILTNLIEKKEINIPNEYYYLTCHREENTRDENNLKEILLAMEKLDSKVVYPVHPRNKERAMRIIKNNNYINTILVEPVGYLTSVYLVNHSKKVITDSGGLQTEAFFANKKCVVVLDFAVWPEIMVNCRVELAKANANDILNKLSNKQIIDANYQPFGDGYAGKHIIEEIERYFNK